MYKTSIVLLLLVQSFSSFGQLNANEYFNDSVYSIASDNYSLAKENLKEVDLDLVDPVNRYYFLEFSLKKQDYKYYRKEIKDLTRNYGFQYTYQDTLNEFLIDVVKEQIHLNKLSEWTVLQSKKLFSKWIASHPEYISLEKKLSAIHTLDQASRRLLLNIKYESIPDLQSINMVDSLLLAQQIDSLVNMSDLENIIALQTICVKNDYSLPTNFDSGWAITGRFSFILFHNLKQGENIYTVHERIYPYIESAFRKQKVSIYFFEMYDEYLNIHSGKQYYGTLDSVPLINAANSYWFRKYLQSDIEPVKIDSERDLLKTFRKIVRTDQSHIRNYNVRDSLILVNYSTIKNLLLNNTSLNSQQKLKNRTKKKLEWGLLLTFIHILQSNPSFLINEEEVEFFAECINRKLLDNSQLKSALLKYNNDIEMNNFPEWADYYRDRIDSVKKKWNIE